MYVYILSCWWSFPVVAVDVRDQAESRWVGLPTIVIFLDYGERLRLDRDSWQEHIVTGDQERLVTFEYCPKASWPISLGH